MILLDTHVWIWLCHGSGALPAEYEVLRSIVGEQRAFVSAISCWEVAKLVERGRLDLPLPPLAWMKSALEPSGITIASITPAIAAESCSLPGEFHRDPADQIIVATARIQKMKLATMDERVRRYPHVTILESSKINE